MWSTSSRAIRRLEISAKTYKALLEIRIAILGDVFTDCNASNKEYHNYISWSSEWDRGGQNPLSRTIKWVIDEFYDNGFLFTQPQGTVCSIYFEAKAILQSKNEEEGQKQIDALRWRTLQLASKALENVIKTSALDSKASLGK